VAAVLGSTEQMLRSRASKARHRLRLALAAEDPG
jgi:hypothetical protein